VRRSRARKSGVMTCTSGQEKQFRYEVAGRDETQGGWYLSALQECSYFSRTCTTSAGTANRFEFQYIPTILPVVSRPDIQKGLLLSTVSTFALLLCNPRSRFLFISHPPPTFLTLPSSRLFQRTKRRRRQKTTVNILIDRPILLALRAGRYPFRIRHESRPFGFAVREGVPC
jgi:hypothetical protein